MKTLLVYIVFIAKFGKNPVKIGILPVNGEGCITTCVLLSIIEFSIAKQR